MEHTYDFDLAVIGSGHGGQKAALMAAKQGLAGPQAQSIATQLDAQIGDVASEIGNAYMGGNSPTDHALKLAEKNLRSDWSESTLKDAINLARTNLKIRRNSIDQAAPIVPGRPEAPLDLNQFIRH